VVPFETREGLRFAEVFPVEEWGFPPNVFQTRSQRWIFFEEVGEFRERKGIRKIWGDIGQTKLS
jgi:hypothetical protein